MNNRAKILICVLVIFHQALFSVEETDSAKVQVLVKSCIFALYSGDLDTVMKCTHPKIISAMGGDEKARSEVDKAMKIFKDAQMQIVAFDWPSEPIILKTTDNTYALVPTHMKLSVRGQMVESFNYQFGHKDEVGSWHFIEGSRFPQVKEWFPDFPKEQTLPVTSRKKL